MSLFAETLSTMVTLILNCDINYVSEIISLFDKSNVFTLIAWLSEKQPAQE